tara:strand:+ start:326 stop:1060 length:735 start_codon:yes stop_codon:yes gene_type:complete
MTDSLTDEYIGMLIDTSIEILFWGHSLPDGKVYECIQNKIKVLIEDECNNANAIKCLKRELHTEIVYGLINIYNEGSGFVYPESIFWVLFAEALSRVDIVHCGLILQAVWTGDVGWLLGGFLRLLTFNNYPSRLDDKEQFLKFVTLCVNINSKRNTHGNCDKSHLHMQYSNSHNDSTCGVSQSNVHHHTTGQNHSGTMDSILNALISSLTSDLSHLSDSEKKIVNDINNEISNLSDTIDCNTNK